ncbi:MAG TPA: M56 family metallopeptidase, partial [Gemmatimonadaceae bacterium]|nr:M56 family metallopeptidase [Gemmatimonadaceae bacterium]
MATSTAENPAAQASASNIILASPESSVGSAAPPSATAPATSGVRDGNEPSAAPPLSNAIKRIAAAGVVPLLVILWIAGLALVLLRLALGTWRVGQLARDGSRVDDGMWLSLTQRVANGLGVSRPLTLLRGERLAVPVTWGIVYPAVLLPEDADTWTEERKRFVLVHEMAHIKRFDALTQLLAQISVAIFWFDPLVWLAAHRMRVEREHACDDYVLRDGTAPSLYAGELLTMVRSIGTHDHDRAAPAFAALAMARRSEFEGRMLAILDPRLDRKQLNRKGALMTALMVALLTIPLAALRPFQTRDLPPAIAVAEAPGASSATGKTFPPAKEATTTAAAPGKGATLDRSCDSHVTRGSGGSMVDLVGRKREGTSTHISTNDDMPSILTFIRTSAGRCAEASVLGPVKFSADEREVTSLAPGGYARFRELTASSDRGVSITADVRGTMTYAASLNGQPAPYDQAAKSWLAQFLPMVVRESGINTKERVARIRSQSGVPGVLREIDAINSPSAKRSHYQELIKTGSLASGDAERVLRQAGKDLSSSGDLSSIVQQIPRSTLSSASSRQAVGDAISRIASSGDRARTISVMAPTAD